MVGPDLDPNCLDTLKVFLDEFFKKKVLKNSTDSKKACEITQ